MRILRWGLFWHSFSAWSGVLFLVAALICFFAYNWAAMPAFLKFGLIAGLMVVAGALSLARGFLSTTGGLSLLACGLLAGALLAVYGQVYQTGADAWELFRAWALFLIPLAIIGRRAGLWFALWLTATLWAGLYLQQNAEVFGTDGAAERRLLCIALGQSAFFVAWEAAAHIFAAPGRPFLQARWFPRCLGLLLILFLACLLAGHIAARYNDYHYTGIYAVLYAALLFGGAYWHIKVRRDLFFVAAGLLSLLAILLSLFWRADLLFTGAGGLFLIVISIIAYATGAGKALIALHKAQQDAIEATARDADETKGAEGARRAPHAHWTARLLMGLCAWIAVPFIMGLMFLLFSNSFDAPGFIVLSLLCLGAGLALSATPGIFTGQASLCLSLTGALTAAILIPLEFHWGTWLFLPALLLFAASGLLSRSAAYRFIALCLAFTLAFVQADITAMTFLPGEYNTEQGVFPLSLLPWLFAAAFALFGTVLVRYWDDMGSHTSRRPVILAALTSLLLLGLLPLFFYSGEFRQFLAQELGLGTVFLRMVGVGAGVALLFFAERTAKALALPRPVSFGAFVLCAAILLLSYPMPWLGVGFLALALARQTESRPLTGLGIGYLACCTIVEYYYLGTSLLHKSYTLGAIGAALCLAAVLLHRQLSVAVRSGALPAPATLEDPALESAVNKDGFRRGLFAACLLGFFLLFGWSVRQKEQLLNSGSSIMLALRPVDPRSLMQGDYMILRLDVEEAIAGALRGKEHESRLKGVAFIAPDSDGVYHFVGLEEDGPPQGDGPLPLRLVYRGKKRGVLVGSGSFFFQEGHGQAYEQARFVEMRVDPEGNALITRLLDENRQPIEPDRQGKE